MYKVCNGNVISRFRHCGETLTNKQLRKKRKSKNKKKNLTRRSLLCTQGIELYFARMDKTLLQLTAPTDLCSHIAKNLKTPGTIKQTAESSLKLSFGCNWISNQKKKRKRNTWSCSSSLLIQANFPPKSRSLVPFSRSMYGWIWKCKDKGSSETFLIVQPIFIIWWHGTCRTYLLLLSFWGFSKLNSNVTNSRLILSIILRPIEILFLSSIIPDVLRPCNQKWEYSC